MIEEKVTEEMDKAWFANQGERAQHGQHGQHGRGPGFGRHNNPGMEHRAGQRHSGEDNLGVSLRQSRGYNSSESYEFQGFGEGRLNSN